jgi:hypothetical protein
MGKGTDWRAGAGNHVAPWIVGAHDKAEIFRSSGECRCGARRQTDRNERALRRGAKAIRAGIMRRISQLFEGDCIGMTEREADTACQRAIAQTICPDNPFIPAQAGIRLRAGYEKAGDCSTKNTGPFVRDNIACALIASALCDHGKQFQDGFDAVGKRNKAKRCGACTIAADGDVKPDVTIMDLRAQSNVGGDCLKAEHSAAVDRDGNLWRQSRRDRALRQHAAQRGGQRAGIENFSVANTGECISEHRNAAICCDAERSDVGCESWSGHGT